MALLGRSTRTGSTRTGAATRHDDVAWHRDAKVLTVIAGTALALLWFAVDVGDRADQALVCWSVLVVQAAALIWFCNRVVRLLDRREPAHRFWWTIRGACVLFTVGDAAQVVSILRDPHTANAAIGGAAQGFLLAAGTGWIVLVMLRYPMSLRSRQERIRFSLDIATVIAGVASFAWYFAIPAAPFGATFDPVSGGLAVLQGPVALLVACFAVAKLMLAGNTPYCRVAGAFAVVTALSGGVARGLGPALVDTAYVNVFFAVTVFGPSLTIAAVLAHERHLSRGNAPPDAVRKRPYSMVPYLAMAATYALLVAVLLRDNGLGIRTWGVLTGALACAALVVVRQVTAFTENASLLGQLRATLRERDALAEALREQAFHDHLTGLANRALLGDRLLDEIRRARHRCRPVVVMLIDLDDFKPVNDRLGHHTGDLVLREVAARLRRVLTNTDTVARFGGDEFAVLLCRQDDPEPIPAVAERILDSLNAPYLLAGETVRINASIGIAVDPDGSWDPDKILHNADTAMYAAKRKGKGTYAVFDPCREDSELA